MTTRNITILSLALLMVTASLAFAQPGAHGFGGPGRGGGEGPLPGRLCEMLDLTEAQQETIDKIHEQGREAGLETRKQIVRLQNELKGLMLQDDPDAGDAEKLVRRIGELRTEQQVRRLQTRLEVRAQLTDEQRDRLIAHQGSRKPGRGGRGHGFGPKRPHGHGGCPPGAHSGSGAMEHPSGGPGRGRF